MRLFVIVVITALTPLYAYAFTDHMCVSKCTMTGIAYPLCVDRCSTREQQQPAPAPLNLPAWDTSYKDVSKEYEKNRQMQLQNEIQQEQLNQMKRDRVEQQLPAPQRNESYEEAPAKPKGKAVILCHVVTVRNGMAFTLTLNIDFDSKTVNDISAEISDDSIAVSDDGASFSINRRNGDYICFMNEKRLFGGSRPVLFSQGSCRKAPGRQF